MNKIFGIHICWNCNADLTFIGRPIELKMKFEKHIINRRGDVKWTRIYERFMITHIVSPFDIAPTSPHKIAPIFPRKIHFNMNHLLFCLPLVVSRHYCQLLLNAISHTLQYVRRQKYKYVISFNQSPPIMLEYSTCSVCWY